MTIINMKIMMKTRSPKVQKANNKSFEILELYEDEVLIFHNNSNKKQTNTISRWIKPPELAGRAR